MTTEQTATSAATASTVIPFDFEQTPIRVVMGADGEPWFVAADLCRVLEIQNTSDTVAQLDEDERGVGEIYTLGGPQKLLTVNESGLYTLIFRSNKPQAKRFRRWVTSVVLPTIRRTGRFEMPGFDATSPFRPEVLLDHLDEIARLIRLTNARDPAGGLAREALAVFGFKIPAAPGVEAAMETLVQYLLDNAGTAFPDHSRDPSRVAVNWPQVAQAAGAMGIPVPGRTPKELRDHPLVERFSYPVTSIHAGKQVACTVIRRPVSTNPDR